MLLKNSLEIYTKDLKSIGLEVKNGHIKNGCRVTQKAAPTFTFKNFKALNLCCCM